MNLAIFQGKKDTSKPKCFYIKHRKRVKDCSWFTSISNSLPISWCIHIVSAIGNLFLFITKENKNIVLSYMLSYVIENFCIFEFYCILKKVTKNARTNISRCIQYAQLMSRRVLKLFGRNKLYVMISCIPIYGREKRTSTTPRQSKMLGYKL